MIMIENECNSFAEAYVNALHEISNEPQYITSPRGKNIAEVTNCTFIINDPTKCVLKNPHRDNIDKYLAGELKWYFTGDNKIETISKYSGFWSGIANPDGTANSAYGDLIFKRTNEHGWTQWGWSLMSLLKDKDSRQAVMYFGRQDFQTEHTKDFPCTCYGQFLIRDNKLHFHIYMRSNDIIRGTTFDVPFFCLLQQNMLLLLQEKYINLKLGDYYHNATSLHLYEEHFVLAEEILSSNTKNDDEFPMMTVPLVTEKGNYVSELISPLHCWIRERL